MTNRITVKDFYKRVKRLQELSGMELTTNVWHKHYSVYTSGPNGSCRDLLVSSDTARDAVDQIGAIGNFIYVFQTYNKRKAK